MRDPGRAAWGAQGLDSRARVRDTGRTVWGGHVLLHGPVSELAHHYCSLY